MSMTSQAAHTLQRRIASGAYQPGGMLPGQRELADAMGISRASLREALCRLETLGFVRSMPGKGTLVIRRGAWTGAHPAAASAAAPPPERVQLWQFRFCVEPANAALAAHGVCAGQARGLWDVQARLEATARAGDMPAASAADLEFHRLVASLSGNAHLLGLTAGFESDLGRTVTLPFAEDRRLAEVLQEHRAIAAAICVGDADGARLAMQHHLRRAARSLALDFVEP